MKLQFVCDCSEFISFPVCLLVYYMYHLLVHILVDPVCDRVSPRVVIESHLLCGCQVIGSHTQQSERLSVVIK